MSLEEATVGWVKSAQQITGLDHLGSAAPCIAVYSALLPGITNVTDRARYYSFYPWFLWKYQQSREPLESGRFHELYRRADCLFTLVAAAHFSRVGGDEDSHGSRTVGTNALRPALEKLAQGKPLRLSAYATQEERPERYFKNRLGGLGQYYLGTLEDLGILTGRNSDFVQYDPEIGREIAQRFDRGVSGQRFWEAVKADKITLGTLESLESFCPCQIPHSKLEHAWLTDLFLGRTGEQEESLRIQRRRTLCLILDLSNNLGAASEYGIGALTFRDACYTGCLSDGKPWNPPEALLPIREHWRLYQRGEILSVGAQTLLSVLTRSLELSENIPLTSREVAEQLLKTVALKKLKATGWSQYVSNCEKNLPPLSSGDAPLHELAVIQELFELEVVNGGHEELGTAMQMALYLFAVLSIRGSANPEYGDLPITPSLLKDYPINLYSFTRARALWNGMTISEVVAWALQEWACDVHLRVALRKMRAQRVDTFRFYPEDGGLKYREKTNIGYSSPRVQQGIQILRDLGGLNADDEGRLRITTLGKTWLEDLCTAP